MLSWHPTFVDDLTDAVRGITFWKNYLQDLRDQESTPFAIHLAIFVEPFLQYVLDGKKTIESRFSSVRCAPFERVGRGDVVLLKKAGGPVVGVCQIRNAWFYNLEEDSWDEIKGFAREICAEDPSFWQTREGASFATLMRIQHVNKIDPIRLPKRDRRGWVVLKGASQQLSLKAGTV
jgi:hypothetical protein